MGLIASCYLGTTSAPTSKRTCLRWGARSTLLLGNNIFPEIGDRYEEAWEKVEGRLARKEEPGERHACSAVTAES
jgi:hypothetical protein